jgi:hypothetical protein
VPARPGALAPEIADLQREFWGHIEEVVAQHHESKLSPDYEAS